MRFQLISHLCRLKTSNVKVFDLGGTPAFTGVYLDVWPFRATLVSTLVSIDKKVVHCCKQIS